MFKFFRSAHTSLDLFSSARSGDVRRARKTISAGVAVDTVDSTGRTPLCLASKYGRTEVMKLLLINGADVNHRDSEGRTPVYHAIYSRSNEAIRMVVEAGADLDITDAVGYSPHDYAVSRSQTEVLEALTHKELRSAPMQEEQKSHT
jgi:ankyrin repeat protein